VYTVPVYWRIVQNIFIREGEGNFGQCHLGKNEKSVKNKKEKCEQKEESVKINRLFNFH
jgi:hypothetical protein